MDLYFLGRFMRQLEHALCECTEPGPTKLYERSCGAGCCFESVDFCVACDSVRSPLRSWKAERSEKKVIPLGKAEASGVFKAFRGEEEYIRRYELERGLPIGFFPRLHSK